MQSAMSNGTASRGPSHKLDIPDLLRSFQSLTTELNIVDGDASTSRATRLKRQLSTVDTATLSRPRQCAPCQPSRRTSASYERLSSRCKALSSHLAFTTTVVICIVLAVVSVGIEVHLSLNHDDETAGLLLFLTIMHAGTLAVFTLEVVVKLVACGERPSIFFTCDDGLFNAFDLGIVVASFATINRDDHIVSLFRLSQLVKILRRLPALKGILLGLVAGIKAVSSIMVLMLLVMFLFSVTGNIFFGENDPAHFANVEVGMLSLFTFATLASWSNIAKINYFGCDLYNGGLYVQFANSTEGDDDHLYEGDDHLLEHTAFGTFPKHVCYAPEGQPLATMLFFFSYTIITAMVILSLFISVITSAMFEVSVPIALCSNSHVLSAFSRALIEYAMCLSRRFYTRPTMRGY